MTATGHPGAQDGLALARGGGLAAWRQIADRIEGQIAAGRLAPGARLPSEAELARSFGVNRHTLRRALAELAARGLLRASQGRGTFVEAPPLRYPIGLRTRFSEIATAAGREARGELLGAAETGADARLAETLEVPPGAPVLELATLHRADDTPISLGRTWLPLPRFAGFDRAYAAAGSLTRAFAGYGVADYLRHSTRVTARPASAEDAAPLDVAPGRVLLAVESVNRDAAGLRIQATRALFVADRVELVVGP
jgi:GntR family phosphonate transport system transcriptional regulator